MADEECANARRAAAAIALEAERAREAALADESQAKLLALRDGAARQAATEQSAAAAAFAAAEAAYEARWRDPALANTGANRDGSAPAPSFGAPLGPVMPSMTESALFDVYADGADPLGRHTLEIAPIEPPTNELTIETPELALNELALIPRPFRADETPQ